MNEFAKGSASQDATNNAADAAPMLDQLTRQAQKLMQHGKDKFSDTSQVVKDKVAQASDVTVGYTKEEPIKAMLIAAASGALLMGLVTLMVRSRD